MKLIDKMTAATADIWAEYNKHPFVKGIDEQLSAFFKKYMSEENDEKKDT